MSIVLVVGGVAEVWSRVAGGWASTVVSAADRGVTAEDVPVPTMATARHLVLRFEDTSDAGDPHGFTPALADEFVCFATAMRNDRQERVVVHCGYGISRSPALALGLLVVGAGHDPERAFEHVLRVRPQAQPNALVVERLDAAAGLGGALWRAFEAWARHQAWWPYPGLWLADAPREERLAALEPMVRRRLAMQRRGSAHAPKRGVDRTA